LQKNVIFRWQSGQMGKGKGDRLFTQMEPGWVGKKGRIIPISKNLRIVFEKGKKRKGGEAEKRLTKMASRRRERGKSSVSLSLRTGCAEEKKKGEQPLANDGCYDRISSRKRRKKGLVSNLP